MGSETEPGISDLPTWNAIKRDGERHLKRDLVGDFLAKLSQIEGGSWWYTIKGYENRVMARGSVDTVHEVKTLVGPKVIRHGP